MNNPQANQMNTAENNRLIQQMPNIRVFYHKKGRAKYISHLDLTRCMQRSLKRAGIPVWYSQGFNPHMYLSFALPLALGYESECEAMDLRLTRQMDFEEIKERLNRALPPDIRVVKAALQVHKPQTIVKAQYQVSFFCQNPAELAEEFDRFVGQEQILVVKRTKKGPKEVDIRPEFSIEGRTLEENQVTYCCFFSAGQKNINPTLLTDCFLAQTGREDVRVTVLRKQVYMENGEAFC